MPRHVRTVAGAGRLAWVDAARGLAIVLVVLFHLTDWLRAAGWHLGGWPFVNEVLASLRMPLFFAVSGALAAGWLHRPMRELLDIRVRLLLWVYLVWQPIGLLAAATAYSFTHGHKDLPGWLLALAASVVRPRSELWFLWALAAFLVVARLCGRRLLAAQFAAAAAVAAAALSTHLVPVTNFGWNGLPKFYLFFLIGLHHRHRMFALAAATSHRGGLAVAVVAAWLATAVAVMAAGWERWPGPGLLTRLLGVLAGMALATLLCRWDLVGGLLRRLGRRSLPIYVAHSPLAVALVALQHQLASPPPQAWLRAVAPVLLCILVTALSLLLHAVLMRGPGRLLYQAPNRPSWPGRRPGTHRVVVEMPDGTTDRSVTR